MQSNRINEILEKIKSVKIAVYGDFCLDAYWLMDPDGSEVSVETGLKAEAVAKHLNRREENSLISYSYVTVPKLKDLPLGEHKQK